MATSRLSFERHGSPAKLSLNPSGFLQRSASPSGGSQYASRIASDQIREHSSLYRKANMVKITIIGNALDYSPQSK